MITQLMMAVALLCANSSKKNPTDNECKIKTLECLVKYNASFTDVVKVATPEETLKSTTECFKKAVQK